QGDGPTVVEVVLCVDEQIGEITVVDVVRAPPDERTVDDVAVVLVDELGPEELLDRRADLLVNVIVVAELLDLLPRCEAEPAAGIGASGRCHVCSCLSSGADLFRASHPRAVPRMVIP